MPTSSDADPWNKMMRGEAHAEAFDAESKRFFQEYPCRVRVEFDPHSQEQRWVVDGFNYFIPFELGLIFGDALNNFRSALDYIAYRMVLANGQIPTTHTAFPICSTKDAYHSIRASRSDPLRGMSDEAIAAIQRHQPCFTVDPDIKQFLNLLRDMNNIDKHRRLHLLAASSSMIGFTAQPGEVAESELHTGPIEVGTVLARVRGPKQSVNLHFTPSVVVDEPASDAHELPASYVLGEIRNQVQKVILHFEETFRPR